MEGGPVRRNLGNLGAALIVVGVVTLAGVATATTVTVGGVLLAVATVAAGAGVIWYDRSRSR